MKINVQQLIQKPLSEKAFLDIRGAFVGYMNDHTVTEQQEMGVGLCLMALDAYYDYKNDWNVIVSHPTLTKEEIE